MKHISLFYGRNLFCFIICFIAIFIAGINNSLGQSIKDQDNATSLLSKNQAVTTEDIENLVATIEDSTKREELVKLLKTVMAVRMAEKEEKSGQSEILPMTLATELIEKLSETIYNLSNELDNVKYTIYNMPDIIENLYLSFLNKEKRGIMTQSLLTLIFVISISLLLWFLTKRLLKSTREKIDVLILKEGWKKIIFRFSKIVLDIIPPLILTAASFGTLIALDTNINLTNAATLIIGSMAAIQIIISISTTIFSPKDEKLRFFSIEDESSQYIFIWIKRLSFVGVIGYSFIQALSFLGVPEVGVNSFEKLLGLIICLMMIVFVLQNRYDVTVWIKKKSAKFAIKRSSKRGPLQKIQYILADIWHFLVIFYLVSLYIVWATEIKNGFMFMIRASFITISTIIASIVLFHILRKGLDKIFFINEEYKNKFPQLERRLNRYIPAIYTIIRTIIITISLFFIMQVWGINIFDWLSSDSGHRLTTTIVTIFFVLLATLVMWESANAWIENYLNAEDEEGQIVQRSARTKTLLPLLRNILMVFLIIFVALIILSELGINIAPLLAGAGVVGLAIGFGSQKLVQDVITGAFILFEDAISIGDIVDVGGKVGLVEGITIRSIRLRGDTGAVHTIPFSAVDKVTNLTKDFSYYIINLGVAYDTETDMAYQVMTEVAEDLQKDPTFGPLILSPLEILGVDQFADSAIMIKARIKTLPIKQWMVGREYNRRLKKALDAAKIQIPFPHLTVHFRDTKKDEELIKEIKDSISS